MALADGVVGDYVEGDEALYRSVKPVLWKQRDKGEFYLSSQAFADRNHRPSVDRAKLCGHDPSHTQFHPSDYVCSLVAEDVRDINTVPASRLRIDHQAREALIIVGTVGDERQSIAHSGRRDPRVLNRIVARLHDPGEAVAGFSKEVEPGIGKYGNHYSYIPNEQLEVGCKTWIHWRWGKGDRIKEEDDGGSESCPAAI